MPVGVDGLSSGVVAIAAGNAHTCALTAAGGVKCWGDNEFGRLGDGTTTRRITPVDVLGLGSGVKAIAAGTWHTCALTAAGGAQCWGMNLYGQLGDGSTMDRHTPVDVDGLGNGVVVIAPSGHHTCALTAAGGAKCWGSNWVGQLGNGTTSEEPNPHSVAVTGLGDGSTLQFGRAVLETDAFTLGIHPLTASYSGDGGHDASVSAALDQEVLPAATSTALDASANPSVFGQAVTLTATVTSGIGTPAGTVIFREGATDVGSAPLNGSGVASLTFASGSLPVGGYAFTAEYGGSASHTGSTSSTLPQTVTKGATTTAVSTSPKPSQPGQTVTITATVSPVAPSSGVPTGTVSFFAGASLLGTAPLSGGTASLQTDSLEVGSHSVTAEYGGDASFSASTSPGSGHVVSPFASTTAVESPGATALGESATFTATVSSPGGVPEGSVTFRDGATVLGSAVLSGGTASLATVALPVGIRWSTAE